MTFNDYLNMNNTASSNNVVINTCSNSTSAYNYAKFITDHYLNSCTASNNTEKKKETKKPMKSESIKVTKVEVLNDRVVMVRFSDGTFTKAICTKDDADAGKFDVDIGITICIMKKLLGEAEGKKKAYEKLIKSIHKMMDSQERAKKEEKELKERSKARAARKAERRAKEAEDEAKEYQNFITEAIKEALKNANITIGGDDLK